MEFHFIITVTGNDGCASTLCGTICAYDGQTRKDLFQIALELADISSGVDQPVVTFFDLAPNELPVAPSPATAACGQPS
jgi:hypothetical protein